MTKISGQFSMSGQLGNFRNFTTTGTPGFACFGSNCPMLLYSNGTAHNINNFGLGARVGEQIFLINGPYLIVLLLWTWLEFVVSVPH